LECLFLLGRWMEGSRECFWSSGGVVRNRGSGVAGGGGKNG
nr:hypothetical protein [Tanacetum cinerariifolium]